MTKSTATAHQEPGTGQTLHPSHLTLHVSLLKPHSPTPSARGELISVAPQFVFSRLSTPLGQAYLKGNVSRCCRMYWKRACKARWISSSSAVSPITKAPSLASMRGRWNAVSRVSRPLRQTFEGALYNRAPALRASATASIHFVVDADIDRHNLRLRDQHFEGDSVTQADRYAMESQQSALQGVQPQRRVMRIGL